MPELLNLPPVAMGAAAAVFGAVMLAVLGVAEFFQRDTGTKRVGAPASVRFSQGNRLYRLLIERLSGRVTPSDEREVGKTRRKLQRAGWYAPHALSIYFSARVLGGLGLPALFNALAPVLAPAMPVTQVLLGSCVLALLGYALPGIVVDHHIAKRQIAVRRGFPDALDLMLVCVEAGLGLDATINRVSQEIGTAHPLLREHFRLMALELQTGKSREQALRAFAERIGVDEVNVLAGLLIQSDALGASIADTLRALSDDMRAKRMLAAEERAQQVGVKLTFPLILLIMPALMLTIGSPAIIQIVRQVGPVLARMGNG